MKSDIGSDLTSIEGPDPLGHDRARRAAQERSLPFKVGAAVADITPPLSVGLLMSSVERQWAPFERVRLPLHTRVVVIERAGRRAALVSLELLGLAEDAVGGMARFRKRVLSASDDAVADRELILTCTHTHSAPESLALSDLFRTATFSRWVDHLADTIGRSLREASLQMRPCALVAGTVEVPGLAIHRRFRTARGVVLSHPEPPAGIVLSREGPVDHSIHVAGFLDESGRPTCLLVNAACHAVHEMCHPSVSPDYPGIMSRLAEERYLGSTVLFFNGAAGNVNPPTVSGGAAMARHHGEQLAEAVAQILRVAQPVPGTELRVSWRSVRLPSRSLTGDPCPPMEARLAALQIGETAMLFLPGEPFAETGLAIRSASPFSFTLVVGYADASVGYVPTDEAFAEGGYEVGPGAWSRVGPGSEGILRTAAVSLLESLNGTGRSPQESASHA